MRLVQATIEHRKAPLARWCAYVTAAIIVSMLVLQLFAFETMPAAIATLLPADFAPFASVIAALLVVGELFAIPFLLPLALSRLARWCALVCCWMVPLAWLLILLVALSTSDITPPVPIFGTKFDIALGILPVCVALLLLSLVATVTTMDYRQRRHA